MPGISTGGMLLPPEAALNTASPLFGRAMAAMYDAINAGLGFNWLRLTNQPLQMGDWTTGDTGSAGTLTSPHYVRVSPSPLGLYYWVGFTYVCDKGSSTPPSVTVSLETAAGVAIDAGVTWSLANGLLIEQEATQVWDGAAWITARGAVVGREVFQDTGWETDRTLAGRLVGLLDVNGHQGEDLVIKVVTAGVRIYMVSALEAYQREVA